MLILLCLSLRLMFFFAVGPWDSSVVERRILRGDALEYHLLAKSLVEDHRYAGQTHYQLDAIRTPGYPLFVGFVYLLFGKLPWIVLLTQIFLDSISCVLLYNIVALSISPKAAVPCAFMYAADPLPKYLIICAFIFSALLLSFITTSSLKFNPSAFIANSFSSHTFIYTFTH